jgi:hypothetical protein
MSESREYQQQIDRLVDGELNDAERRALLRSFDARPDGWRRCALAFLEAQSWGRTFQAMAREGEPAKAEGERGRRGEGESLAPRIAPSPLPPLSPSRKTASRQSGRFFALAASVAAAFAFGWLLPDARGPSEPLAGPTAKVAEQAPSERSASPAPRFDEPFENAVRMVVDEGRNQAPRTVEVPLVEGRHFDRLSDWEGPWSIPQRVFEHLEQLGHRVERRRRYAPVELKDGRRMIVPVEDLRVVPVGRRVY